MSLVDGLPLAEGVRDAANAVADGSWIGTAGGAAAVADAVADIAADPVGTIMAGGFGFVFEHVPGLRDALDAVSGDSDAIDAVCASWRDAVATPIAAAAEDLGIALDETRGAWVGEAADGYRSAATALAGHVEALALAARAAATGVRLAGTFVLEVRTWIRDQLASFAGWLAAGYVIAAAASAETFGASVVTWMNGAIARGAVLARRFTRALEALTGRLEAVADRLGRLGEATGALRRGAVSIDAAVARTAAAGGSGRAAAAVGSGVRAGWATSRPSVERLTTDAVTGAMGAVAKSAGDAWKTFSATAPDTG